MAIGIKGITMPVLEISLDSSKSITENVKEIQEKLSSDVLKGSVAVVNYKGLSLSEDDKREVESVLAKSNTRFLGYSPNQYSRRSSAASIYSAVRTLKVVDKTVRSGQRIEHEGDILIIGDVNPDSYLVALGNIIVLGTLRGIVHAGAKGDDGARVIALILKPQQLRIGGYITRAPDEQEEVPDFPEMAYVRDEQIFIEKL